MNQDFLYSAEYDFPNWDGKPRKTIALLFMPRSGSTVLACLMAQTQRLGFPLEYFSLANMAGLRDRLSHLPSDAVQLVPRVRTSPNGVFSYKWNYDFENLAEVGGINAQLNPSCYLLIDRDDKYAQAKSLALARKTKEWLLPKTASPEGRWVSVTEQEITSAADSLRTGRARLDSIVAAGDVPCMEISYEALLEDPQGILNRIASFCGEPIEIPVSLADVPISKQAAVPGRQDGRSMQQTINRHGEEIRDAGTVLIATHHLENYAGTEIVALELAQECMRRGWRTTVASFIVGEPIARDFRAAGIELVSLFEAPGLKTDYDLIWVSHRPVYEYLFGKLAMRAKRVVFASHSPYEPLEALPEDLSAADLIVANSEETAAGIGQQRGDGLPPVVVFPNSAPEPFFANPAPRHQSLSRVAVVSNHPPEEILAATRILEADGVQVDVIGLEHRPRRVTPELLAAYDMAISIGKTVQYCFALGLPVYCYDRFGGPGWLNLSELDRYEQVNYSGRGDTRRTPDTLRAEVVDGFAAACADLDALRALARERYDLARNLDRIVAELGNLPERRSPVRPVYSRANDYYISELRGRLYLAHVDRVNARALAERDQARQQLATADSELAQREQLVFRCAKLLADDVQYLTAIRQAQQGGKKALLAQAVAKATEDRRLADLVNAIEQIRELVRNKKQGRGTEPDTRDVRLVAAPDAFVDGLSIGIMAHVYYVDLFDEICAVLARFPYPYALRVSVVDEAAAEAVRGAAAQLANLTRLDVRVVANRGRDLAPFFVAFRDDILALDLVCHVHTKKSLYTGTERTGWRQYLYQNLLGTPERVGAIFGRFATDPKLGVVYPESYPGMPFWGHTWLSNKAIAMQLAQRLGYRIDPGEYLDFPAGSMFWARPQALKPLFDLNLGVDSFPVESGQTDGTLQHALERYLGVVPGLAGYTLGVLADDGSLRPTGGKNWRHHLAAPLAGKLVAAAARARIVSVDVFDTLVMRPFLHPDVVFDFIGEFLQARHGLADFKRLRKQAEARARQAKGGRDVDLDDIYASFQAHFPADPALIDELKEIEQGMELWFTRPRSQPIRLLRQLAEQGMRIVAVSDMYLPAALIRRMLDHVGADFVQTLYLSSETGWRKDTGEAWRQLPVREGVEPGAWLHVGDNEHSDIQLPVDAGFLPPVHILRPAAMLATLPCLSALHRRDFLPWPDQLWLGLVGNRLAELSDRSPAAFGDALRLDGLADIGYLCFGPVVANYVLWLARRCAGAGHRALLFLSREGYLLEKVFAALQASIPALAGMQGRYFLTSRRAAGVAAMQTRDDLGYLLGAHFKGRVGDLIRARFGDDILAAYRAAGDLDLDREVTLPAMKDAVLSGMLASRAAILEIAARERAAYLDYWRAEVPDGPAALSDLGFSGTIQKFLMALTGRKLDGFYFATTAKVAGLKQLGVAVEGLYGDGVALQHAGVPVFDYSLILEAVLTAPAGQFQHFERSGEGLRPVFKQAGHSQTHFDRVAAIQQGMLDFVADLVAAVGERIYDAEFDRDLVQVPLRLLVDGTWSLGEHEALFSVEDDFSGFGEISCFQHYRRLAERPGPAEPAGRAEGPAETG